MPLTNREAFKVGFLARCVEARMTPEQMLSQVKQAQVLLTKHAFLDSIANGVAGMGKSLASYAIPAALIAPPVLGGLAGYGLAKATDVDDTDVDEIKNREVIDEYKRQAAKLQRQRAVRDYQLQRKQTGRVFM